MLNVGKISRLDSMFNTFQQTCQDAKAATKVGGVVEIVGSADIEKVVFDAEGEFRCRFGVVSKV